MKTASNGGLSSLKAPLGAFFGPAGGFFSQKKRVFLRNVKYSGIKGSVSLAKSYFDEGMYSDMESNSSSSIVNDILVGSSDKSFFGSAATTPKAKRVKNDLVCSFPLGSLNYDIDDNDGGFFPPPLGISLERKWLNPKIVKTQVEVAVKNFFALDINLSAMKSKSAMAKTQVIRKLFSKINGFGGATTSSKFEGIIRSIFTSEISIEKAVLLAREIRITINTNLKKQGICSDQAIVIKEILMDTSKKMIIAAFSEFGQVKTVIEFAESSQADLLAAKWSFLIRKNSVRMAKAFRTLLFTLPVGTIAHDLENVLEKADGKTCVINWSLKSGNRTHCAVVGFKFDKMLESAFCMVPIFGGVKLSWARLGLVWCNRCGKLGHSVLECDAEIASTPKPSKLFINGLSSGGLLLSTFTLNSALNKCLLSLEQSLELLSDQVSCILKCLNGAKLVPLVPVSNETPAISVFQSFASVLSVVANSNSLFNMVLDSPDGLSDTSFPIATDGLVLGSSSSKVLTSKLDSFESKFVVLEVLVNSILVSLVWKVAMCNIKEMNNSVKQNDIIRWHKEINNVILIVTKTKLKDKICPWIMGKFDSIWVFTSGLDSGHLGSGIAIIMNNFLVWHVCKVLDISGQFLSLRLLFKNNLSVLVLGLYVEASLVVHFSQADNVNSLIAKVVNESSFVILGGDFNKDGSYKSVSFKRYFDLGLVNSLGGSSYGKEATWNNSRGVAKTIDYVFVLSNLVNAILDHGVAGIEEFFNTDHRAVFVSVGLGGLLDFKDETAANAAMLSDDFLNAKIHSDLNAMWDAVHKTLCFLANVEYDSVFTKTLSRFHRLELLVFKLVKASWLIDYNVFTLLLETWILLDSVNALLIRKSYHASKLLESKCAENSYIRFTINKKMESFELDKSHTIKSVLEWPFHKVVLDHLVVGKELILESDYVKDKEDEIMEGWTQKQDVSLEHVFDDAFSNVMDCVSFVELFGVVSNLSNGKAAGLLGISNEF
ncbi:hypothetical protein G9A89_023784 [Geosiphon pyriformis]|nr:hypothetical protein G9A89_023784 [Geosiphon pyriformis]